MHVTVKERMVGELDENLTSLPLDEIRRHLEAT